MPRVTHRAAALSFCAALLAAAAPARAEEQLLVYRFEVPPDMTEEHRDMFADLLAERLAHHTGRRTVSPRELSTLVEAETGLKRAGNCADEQCLTGLASLAQVRYFLAARIFDGERGRAVSLKVFDRQSGAVALRRWVEAGERAGGVAAALDTLASAVAELLAGGPTAAARQAAVATGEPRRAGVRWGPLALVVGGAASLAVGVGFGLDARAHFQRVGEEGGQLEVAPGERSQLIANVAYGVGAVAALTGIVLWLLPGGEVAVAAAPDGGTVELRLAL